MIELLTADQMRALERAAIESGEVTGLELMERAGRGVVQAMLDWQPELAVAPHRALVLCGPGNNGGDGLVVARLLKERGWAVEVFLCGDEHTLPPDAAENAGRWRQADAITVFPPTPEAIERDPAQTVIIDALFGTGLTRALDGELAEFVGRLGEMAAGHRPPVVSVDLPSGLCADSGRVLGAAVRAELTVSFHLPKRGHYLAVGPAHCGRLGVVDIGLRDTPGRPADRLTCGVEEWQLAAVSKGFAAHGPQRHKYDHGHALVLSGPMGRGGAARLAAQGALRIGAGLVTVGCPPSAVIEHASHLTAIMLRPVDGARGVKALLEDGRINAVCLGPGMGSEQATRDVLAAVLAQRRGTVLDADALTAFAEDPAALFADLHDGCVLTPHAGEFARLFPDLHDLLAEAPTRGPGYSKADAVREAARRAGAVVLLKGADTVIATPDGRTALNAAHYDRAAPWLATAGAGDVLAGFIAGLLARGLDPAEAATLAAWLHVEAARRFGPGLIAEDLPEQLPPLFSDLGL